MGAANENSFFGPVKNYADETRVSGGSSGGSAVAVQAGYVPCGYRYRYRWLGKATRIVLRCYWPKANYGRISRHGVISYASSFDQVGPFN
jgi:aspartyl-tRNA(Asn)/glutamyl-tRNA(Gln) amidotransferase subunit A